MPLPEYLVGLVVELERPADVCVVVDGEPGVGELLKVLLLVNLRPTLPPGLAVTGPVVRTVLVDQSVNQSIYQSINR